MATCVAAHVYGLLSAPSDEELRAVEVERARLEEALLRRVAPQQPGQRAVDDAAGDDDDAARNDAARDDAARDDAAGGDGVAGDADPEAAPPLDPARAQRLLDDLRAGRRLPPDDPLSAPVAALEATERALRGRDLAQRWGYRASDGLSLRLLLAAFVHGGWLHLLGNLLFLWLAGCNLEDRWGGWAFAGLFLLGAAVSSGFYGLWHRGDPTPLIGASGAIAAAMGAFLVCFRAAEIRFWYLFFSLYRGLRMGTFETSAMVALPLWFLAQLFNAWLEGLAPGGTAYSAHVGGFLFGLAAALGVRRSGLEARHLLPRASRGVEWEQDPDLVRALDLIKDGDRAGAAPLLRAVLARRPREPTAQRELCAVGLELGDAAAVSDTASAVLSRLAQDRQPVEVVDLYRRLEERAPDGPLDDRALASVARCAIEIGDVALGVRTTGLLLQRHPRSALIPRALWEVADAQERAGRPDLCRKTLERLVSTCPMDALAEQARARLARPAATPEEPG